MNRKFCLLLVCLLTAIGAQAQQGRAAERVAEIRDLYNEAKRMIEYNNMLEETRNQLVVNASFMAPATGHRDDVVYYYFTTDYDEDRDRFVSEPYFVTRSYNIAARKMYEELLFHEGKLVFAYYAYDDFDGGKDEGRYYFDKDGRHVVHKILKGNMALDEAGAIGLAKRLSEAFQRLVVI